MRLNLVAHDQLLGIVSFIPIPSLRIGRPIAHALLWAMIRSFPRLIHLEGGQLYWAA
jgi:hypothetical protein